MATREELWWERRKRAVEHKVRVRVDRMSIKARTPRRGYEVVIQGFNLHRAISPPRITVGEVTLEQIDFDPGGLAIRGILPRQPRSRRVVVDYGFARAEWSGQAGNR